YRVRAHGSILQPQLDALRKGVTVDGVRYGAIEATVDRVQGANVWLTFAIREGKNREVRNVLEHLGLKVNRLIRVSFGPFQLGDLPEGAVEEVRTRHLREQLGERIATQAEADFTGPITMAEEPEDEPVERKDRGKSEKPEAGASKAKKTKAQKLRERFKPSDRPATGRTKRDRSGNRAPKRKR
ncbi:MAG: pseudouridine synthase, partial [Pseudorhodoplanes sp.]